MTPKITTTPLILAAFALMTTGVLAIPSAFAQDGDLDFDRDTDLDTGSVQVADATSEQNEENRQGNLISLVEELLNTNALQGGDGGGAATGGGPSGITSDSNQGQSADDASQGNGALFGDDLGIATAFNVGQVNVDLRNLVDLTPSSPSTTE